MNRLFTQILVDDHIYVSSKRGYFADVIIYEKDRLTPRVLDLHTWDFLHFKHRTCRKMPRYVINEVFNQLKSKHKQEILHFYEYHRHGPERFDNLRYYDPDYFDHLISSIPNEPT